MNHVSERLVVQLEVADFLVAEAAALDERRFDDWLTMLADDIVYRVPARTSLARATLDDEFEPPSGMNLLHDDKRTLVMRVGKLRAATSWAENPPSRTRRMITNVRVVHDDGATLEARSNFLVYKGRLETNANMYVGTRTDALRRTDGGFVITSRVVFLDETVLAANNLSIFL